MDGILGKADTELVPALAHQRSRRLERMTHHVGELDHGTLERDLAADDARDIEEVIDDAREMTRLPLDHGTRPLQP